MTFMVILMGTKVLRKMGMDLNCGLKKGKVVLLSITSILDFLIQKLKITHITLITLCNNKKKVKNIRYKNFLLKNFHRNLIDKFKK